ncbi:MAG: two-component hybrid protein sensory box hisitidine kinase/adenylate cyclase, partial [Phycisphaerales bacterium]|nr:two-component hybrid protein sensory box hisitidine kinase/adenylate cyclase [Phycisphaerales bacterium]
MPPPPTNPAANVPPVPRDEVERLAELRDYDVLDTDPESAFDDLTWLASHICGAPIALLTLVDAERQWFKSRVGLGLDETRRDVSFCAHAIVTDDVMVVPDASRDARFATNPLVTSDPNVRFYAGAPLVTPGGRAIGTMCVLDRTPRDLTVDQTEALRSLGRQAVAQLELRRALRRERDVRRRLAEEQERSERLLDSLLPRPIAERLKASPPGTVIADSHAGVTVLLADLQDFARLTRGTPPAVVVALLGDVFTAFDRLCATHGVTKVKTVGDAYVAVAGLPGGRPDHVAAAADLALAMQQAVAALPTSLRAPLSLRVGMHCGPVVAGVVGTARLAYDLWGETVNIAARMEGFGIGG